ncbi:MAG: phosphate acyltransferase PlsX [Candidatus Promineifilaceae bacterium]|nr:phosphate acyltransferase PlsX [Candidatus Promineifilaceae bacterium]
MRIVVDAMGSDAHPEPDVAGAVMAAQTYGDEMILVGDEKRIQAELDRHDTHGLAIEICHASQVIGMTDKPGKASRSKKDSSMHVGLGLVKDGQADAFVSAGNTGGILAVATLHTLRRIRGVLRPALGVIFPITERPMLIDHGANADCKPEYLLQFGLMGSLYVERVRGVKAPRVALLSNGEEEGKGNLLIKESAPLLAASSLNYIGNIEPKEFVRGQADVAVTDGFTGNLVLKTAEAIASYMSDMIRTEIRRGILTTIGGLLARPAFGRVRRRLDPDEVGGAPLLGVNGVVIVGHGRSNAYAIQQAISQARLAVEQDIVAAIQAGIAEQDTR